CDVLDARRVAVASAQTRAALGRAPNPSPVSALVLDGIAELPLSTVLCTAEIEAWTIHVLDILGLVAFAHPVALRDLLSTFVQLAGATFALVHVLLCQVVLDRFARTFRGILLQVGVPACHVGLLSLGSPTGGRHRGSVACLAYPGS